MREVRILLCLSIALVLMVGGDALAQQTKKDIMVANGQMLIDTGKAMMEEGSKMIDNGNIIRQESADFGALVTSDGKEMMDLGQRIVKHGEQMMMEKEQQRGTDRQ